MNALESRPKAYTEISPLGLAVGFCIGVMMTSSFAYAALVMGFSTNGSTLAAILGWGIMRSIFRRGTIVENNIIQTTASAINTSTAGVIFTVPVLLIRGSDFSIWTVGMACVAGAILGVGFIIPIRKQMIEIERLRFPSGTAVSTILQSPSAGASKSLLLVLGALVSGGFYLLTQTDRLGWSGDAPWIPASVDFGALLGLPAYIDATCSLSMFALGIGFISGRNGLFVLAGGVLSYWLITPATVALGWVPDGVAIADHVHGEVTRPLGIGMLLGGALMGVVLTFPAVKAAIAGLRKHGVGKTSSDELSLGVLAACVAAAFVVFLLAAWLTGEVGLALALVIALVGTAYLWFSGIIVAQATGMTDWTPISGMSLIAVVLLMLFLSAGQTVTAVLIGAAICVAIAECADMMQDLKTGQLVGSYPFKQQLVQLSLAGLGPVIALSVMMALWNSGPVDPVTGVRAPGFGPGTEIEAPQAVALGATIDTVLGGDVPHDKFLAGALVGGALSFSGIPGLGVIVGISMYLPLSLILPYGVGALINMGVRRVWGARDSEEWGVPPAAGLIVGQSLLTVILALLTIAGVIEA